MKEFILDNSDQIKFSFNDNLVSDVTNLIPYSTYKTIDTKVNEIHRLDLAKFELGEKIKKLVKQIDDDKLLIQIDDRGFLIMNYNTFIKFIDYSVENCDQIISPSSVTGFNTKKNFIYFSGDDVGYSNFKFVDENKDLIKKNILPELQLLDYKQIKL